MNCKDCVHVDVCRHYTNELAKSNGIPLKIEEVEKLLECDDCEYFKDRSRFVELTSKVFVCPEGFCDFITAEIDGVRIKLSDSYSASIGLSEIGKTVFLTREEAEQALKEREENETDD